MPRPSAASLSAISGLEPVARLEPPPDLSGPERAVFAQVILSVRPDHFQVHDAILLAAYARAAVLEKQASAELALGGPVVDGKPSPWLPILAQSSKALLALARQLRLSPLGARRW